MTRRSSKPSWTRAINQALEPDVAMQNLYKVWGYQAELEEATCGNAPCGPALPGGKPPGAVQALQCPALISLTDETGGLCYAALVGLGADRLPCSSAARAGRWTGSGSPTPGGVATPCSGACPGQRALIASNAGAAQVQWLDARPAMQQPDRKVSRFDATLKNKLQRFQREQG